MIELNIFNPNNKKNKEEKRNQYWMDINLIYELFIKLIENEKCDIQILKQYIKNDFIIKFIQLFSSKIEEEKNILKLILHKLYSKIICRRKFIRNIIGNYLILSNIKLNEYNGVKELLDVMSSIVSGFAIPLRNEHIIFFKNIITPLYKSESCNLYFNNLVNCSILFLEKDRTLSIPLLERILDYFNFQDYNMKISFLDEIKEIFNYCDIDKMKPIIQKLFNTILKCFSEYNNELIHTALFFFSNQKFIFIIKKYINISFNIIVPKVHYFAQNHWDETIKNHFNNVCQILRNIDYIKYNSALNINLDHEMKLLPQNKEEEERQIKLAIQLSLKEKSCQSKNNDDINNIDKIKNTIKFKNLKIINIKKSIFDSINNQISEIDEQFDEEYGICPITSEYMENPVLCPSGNYYEKSALLDWLKRNNTEPLTRQYLTADMLIEDKEFKKKIIEYRKKFNK